jgi:hypothetical protein
MTMIYQNNGPSCVTNNTRDPVKKQPDTALEQRQRDFEAHFKRSLPSDEEQEKSADAAVCPVALLPSVPRAVSLARSEEGSTIQRPSQCGAPVNLLDGIYEDAMTAHGQAKDGTLSVNVLSGPLSGSEINVIATAGHLLIRLRAVKGVQYATLEAIRSKIEQAVSIFNCFEIQLEQKSETG